MESARAADLRRLLQQHEAADEREAGFVERMLGLLDSTADEVEWDRIGSARRLAAETDAIAVLKGAPTVIAHPEGTAFLNPTGNPGMATAGSGDVLTGILTALLGQGLDPLDAAMLGAYLHGHAGDLAAEEHGAGLIAGDVVREIPRALIDLAAPSTE